MGIGYHVMCSISGDDASKELPELHDFLLCDKTLDGALNRIKQSLQTWIETGDSKRRPGGQFRHFDLTITGPLPKEARVVDRRTPEQRLADADSPGKRFNALKRAAKSRFEAGQFEEARNLITELEEMLPNFEDHWNYWDAAEAVQIVLGRLALQSGDVEEAKRILIEAGRSNGSSTMSSSDSDMSLARDLLVAGEKQAVLDYFEACRKFWPAGSEELDIWEMYVNAGRIPDFGANLVY